MPVLRRLGLHASWFVDGSNREHFRASRRSSIVVPGTGLSLEQVRWFILKVTGRSPVQIEATVVSDPEDGIRLAVACSECRPRFFWVVPACSNADDMDAILHRGAIEIYRRLRPYRTALYFYRQRDDQACREAIRSCLLNDSPEDDAWASNLAGLLAMRHEDFESAERWFRRATRIDPSLAVSFKNWGRLERRRGNLEGARRKLLDALRLDSESASTYYLLALLAHGEGDYAEAEELYERAYRIDPARLETVYNWAVVAWKQRRWSDALDRIDNADSVAKGMNRQVLSTWARWLRKLGEDAERNGRRVQARRYFEQSAEKLEEILDRGLIQRDEWLSVTSDLAHLYRSLGRREAVHDWTLLEERTAVTEKVDARTSEAHELPFPGEAQPCRRRGDEIDLQSGRSQRPE